MTPLAVLIARLERSYEKMRATQRAALAGEFTHRHPDLARRVSDDLYKPSRMP